MKKMTILTLALLLTLSGAQAVENKGFVSVESKVSKEYQPNVASVKFYIEDTGKDLKKATDENKQKAKVALDAVKKILNTKQGDMIRTSSFNVSSQYSYKNNKKTFENYSITNGFEVVLKDIKKLSNVIDAGLKAGATRVDGLNFTLDNTKAACDELIIDAVKDSKLRAQKVARALDTMIIGTKNVQANCSSNGGYYPQFRMTNSAKMLGSSADYAESTSIPTEAGTIKLEAFARGEYFVGQ